MKDPRDVNQADYPRDGSFKDKALFLLNDAVLAPSSHNSQPWLFEVNEDSIKLFADTSRALPILDSYNRELMISCGAAIGNLEVGANYFCLSCEFDYFPDARSSDHLVDVSLSEGHEVTANDRRLFSAIKDRTTTRKSLLPYTLPESVSAYLKKQASEVNIEFELIVDQEHRQTIAELISEADRKHFSDPEFRSELSQWIRASKNQQHDGMAVNSYWTPSLLAKLESMIIKRFDVGSSVASKDKELTEESPTLGLIATESEEPSQWFATGMFLSRILLYLTASGISVGYMNQAVEIADIRRILREEADVTGYPQLLLRIGKAEMSKQSARRPLTAVLR